MYEPYLRVAEELNRRAPGASRQKNAAALDRRRGDRERGEDRARVYAPAGGRRVHARLPRPHAARALDDGKERAVQTALRSVLQRDLPRAVSLRTSRRDDARALEALEELFAGVVAPDRVAAIIIEPVLGEGGFVPAPRGVLAGARAGLPTSTASC